MVNNCFIQCQVCNSITRIRHQIGWLPEHPIIVCCGKCKTSLIGNVVQNQKSGGLKYSFNNAGLVDTQDADYTIECSGEYPTTKLQSDKGILSNPITPFIRFTQNMEEDNSYNAFCEDIAILMKTRDLWTRYSRIINLYQNGQTNYLMQELTNLFPESIIQTDNPVGILQAVHLIEIHSFDRAICKNILEDTTFYTNLINNLDHQQLDLLINYMDNSPGYELETLQSSIYKIFDRFISLFPYLIPAMSLYYSKMDHIDFTKDGTSTSDFESVESFFLSLYETLGNLLIIPIALNNIFHRKDYNCLNNLFDDKKTLDDFCKLGKVARYKYCLANESYTSKLLPISIIKLRNAIGHQDYEYDPIQQVITYSPDQKKKGNKKYIYLLEVEYEMIKMFKDILIVSEYLYQLRKYKAFKEIAMSGI